MAVYGAPIANNSTTYKSINDRDPDHREGFTYNGKIPTVGTITSISHIIESNGAVFTTITNLRVSNTARFRRFSNLRADVNGTVLSGTVSSIVHVAVDGVTVLTGATGRSVSLDVAADPSVIWSCTNHAGVRRGGRRYVIRANPEISHCVKLAGGRALI